MIKPDFVFSQHSLGDFQDCARRFYLRNIAQQTWPLLEGTPDGSEVLESVMGYRDYLRKGALLHQWIQRWLLGLGEPLSPLAVTDPELSIWWQRFRETDLGGLPALRLPELELAAPLGGRRLYARFDLLAINERDPADDIVIVDWKTIRGKRAPSQVFLRDRLQTRVYLYVLATAGAPYNGGRKIAPEQCVMRYWLAEFPEQPWEEIRYSQAEYDADQRMLLALADDIAGRVREADFPLTDVLRRCAPCTYRTLCGRAGVAAQADPLEDGETQWRAAGDEVALDY